MVFTCIESVAIAQSIGKENFCDLLKIRKHCKAFLLHTVALLLTVATYVYAHYCMEYHSQYIEYNVLYHICD